MFASSAITEWIDPPNDDDSQPGTTALCPHCGIDAVLPSALPGLSLTPDLLQQMRDHWFERAS
jgi:hypothetical protein